MKDLQNILENSKLKTHQEFQLIQDKNLLQKASKEQLIDLYVKLAEQLMIKDNLVKELIKYKLSK